MKLFFFILQFAFLLNVYSQEKKYDSTGDTLRNNALYVQGLGNALTLFSLNYERILLHSSNNIYHLSGRIGGSVGRTLYDTTSFCVLPIELVSIVGKRTLFFEAAIGITLNFGDRNLKNVPNISENVNNNFYYFFPLRFGFRFVSEDALFRVSPLIILLIPKNQELSHIEGKKFFGVSLGLMF